MNIVVGVDTCGESNLVFLELITKIIKEQFKGIETRTRKPKKKYTHTLGYRLPTINKQPYRSNRHGRKKKWSPHGWHSWGGLKPKYILTTVAAGLRRVPELNTRIYRSPYSSKKMTQKNQIDEQRKRGKKTCTTSWLLG